MSEEILDEYPKEPKEPYVPTTPGRVIDWEDPLAVGESGQYRIAYLLSLLDQFEPGSESYEHILYLLGKSPDIGHPPRSSLRDTIALDGLPNELDPYENN